MRDDPDRYGGKQSVKQARRLARSQQDDLRRRAFRLAATVYAEQPRAFARRVRTYWELTADSGLEAGDRWHRATRPRGAPHAARRVVVEQVERERKYLLAKVPALSDPGTRLRQGYLAIDGSVSVRVRESGDGEFTLTVKAGRGAVRTELEWPLTDEQFDAAWDQTRSRRIHKTRHRVPLDEHTIEVDVFHDDLDGLLLAEVEFESDDALAAFEPPAWFGPEVTDDEVYTNASLAANAGHGRPSRP